MASYILSICHCTLNHYRIKLSLSQLPLPSSFCHCNTCRHSSGQLFTNTIPIQGLPLTPSSNEGREEAAHLRGLVAYRTSSGTTRFFCIKCSAYMFLSRLERGVRTQFYVFTGSLDRVEDVTYIQSHNQIADTLDGGLADHYRTEAGAVIRRFSGQQNSPQVPIGWKANSLPVQANADRLPFRCHCGTISFYLARTTEIKDPETQYWLVPTGNGLIRYVGGHDVCIDCRLSSGNQFQSWIIVPHEAVIHPQTGVSVDLSTAQKRLPGLKQYESSPGKFRESCETCGASVFWWKDGAKKLDIAAGLVDESVGGVRAESWVYWHDKVVHPNDALERIDNQRN